MSEIAKSEIPLSQLTRKELHKSEEMYSKSEETRIRASGTLVRTTGALVRATLSPHYLSPHGPAPMMRTLVPAQAFPLQHRRKR